MKSTSKTKKEQNAKPVKARREAPAKAADATADNEPGDRLPANVEELKATKGGLVSFLFLSGKDKDAIAKELKMAFKLTEVQAVKITRRITGRARFFQRAFALTSAR